MKWNAFTCISMAFSQHTIPVSLVTHPLGTVVGTNATLSELEGQGQGSGRCPPPLAAAITLAPKNSPFPFPADVQAAYNDLARQVWRPRPPPSPLWRGVWRGHAGNKAGARWMPGVLSTSPKRRCVRKPMKVRPCVSEPNEGLSAGGVTAASVCCVGDGTVWYSVGCVPQGLMDPATLEDAAQRGRLRKLEGSGNALCLLCLFCPTFIFVAFFREMKLIALLGFVTEVSPRHPLWAIYSARGGPTLLPFMMSNQPVFSQPEH